MNAIKQQQSLSWFEAFTATAAGAFLALLLFGIVAETYLKYKLQSAGEAIRQNINKGVTKR